jgi:hypothetical protein
MKLILAYEFASIPEKTDEHAFNVCPEIGHFVQGQGR